MSEKFELTLAIALPSAVRKVLRDQKGRAFVINKLKEATFAIAEDSESSLTLYKSDPIRAYFLAINDDSVLYKMVIINPDFIVNPYKYFVEVLIQELGLLRDIAAEYISSSQNASTSQNHVAPPLYIG